jgi:competence protein ComEC
LDSINHRQFWLEQPALLFGLSLLIGSGSFLFWEGPWGWIWPLFWGTYLALHRFFPPILVMFAGVLYAWALYSHTPEGSVGYFKIAFLKPHQSPFERGLMYQGTLYIDGQRIPCSVHHSFGEQHPKANCDYILQGTLKKRGPYDYLFKAKSWTPVENTWSFAEVRFRMKERLRHFLNQKLPHPQVASFLGSLITGDVEDRTLRYEFGRLGLQHILAISGFHFAILIAFCSFFLGLFLPFRWKYGALLVAIQFYFLFVGSVPAVQRSWLTAVFYLVGKLIGRQSSGLNLLGVALLIEVILNPLVSGQIGFQLSFVSCAGILLLHPFFQLWSARLFPRYDPSTLTPFAQHGYLLTSFLREAISLAAAVTIAILPLILYHFHSFPLLSLLYNLFFPAFVSLALFALLISLLADLLFPPLGWLFFGFTNFFTSQLLHLASYPPLALHVSLQVQSFPAWLIPIYLFTLFSLSRLTNTYRFE